MSFRARGEKSGIRTEQRAQADKNNEYSALYISQISQSCLLRNDKYHGNDIQRLEAISERMQEILATIRSSD